MNRSTTEAASDLTDDITRLKDDVLKIKEDLTNLSGRIYERGKESAHLLGKNVKEHAQHTAESASEFVHERPFTTALVAAGVGIVVGSLLWRR